MRLSHQKRRLLRHIMEGLGPNHHCKTMSDYGGLHGTMFWATKHNLIAHDGHQWNLTPEGLALAHKEFGPPIDDCVQQ